MKELKFRTLTADEIECRVAQAGKSQKGAWCSLLLYKDARCDQRLLDETVGCFRWKREHELINGNLFCTVSIKDEEGEWVSKQDVGTESNTEKEKGQASDAFKRACFNWGLGRELYTSPKIFVSLEEGEYSVDQANKVKVSARTSFKVTDIAYDDKRNICLLRIADSNGKQRYSFESGTPVKTEKKQTKAAPKKTEEKQPEVKLEANPESHVSFEDVKKEIEKSETKEQLVAIFNKYTIYQADAEFLSVLRKRKDEILGNHGTAAA